MRTKTQSKDSTEGTQMEGWVVGSYLFHRTGLVLRCATQISDTVFMPKKSGQKRDFMQVAREVVEHAIGERMDGSPIEQPVDTRNQHAVVLGSIGGNKGGKARAKSLSAKRRKEIAQLAASARWSSKQK
jgi:hypothetical protein